MTWNDPEPVKLGALPLPGARVESVSRPTMRVGHKSITLRAASISGFATVEAAAAVQAAVEAGRPMAQEEVLEDGVWVFLTRFSLVKSDVAPDGWVGYKIDVVEARGGKAYGTTNRSL